MADDAAYGLLGARVEALLGAAWTLGAEGQAGAASRADGGRWLYGRGAVAYAARVGPMSALADVSAFRLHYSEPYLYDAQAVRVEPALRANMSALYVTARGDFVHGDWSNRFDTTQVSVPGRPAEPARERGDLRIAGVEAVMGGALGPVGLELGGQFREATNGVVDGAYGGGSVAATIPLGPANLFGSAHLQQTPDELEFGYDAGVVARLSERIQLLALLANAPTDPLFGTRSGLGISIGVSVRAGAIGAVTRPGVAAVGARNEGRRTVTFRVRDERGGVQVAGSFNGWTPVEMEQRGGVWMIDLAMEPGTYQFAFLRSDGTWFVPADAPGIVDDGFGRSNATLIVPPL